MPKELFLGKDEGQASEQRHRRVTKGASLCRHEPKEQSNHKVVLELDGQRPKDGVEPRMSEEHIDVTKVEGDLGHGWPKGWPGESRGPLRQVAEDQGQPDGRNVGRIETHDALEEEATVVNVRVARVMQCVGYDETRDDEE